MFRKKTNIVLLIVCLTSVFSHTLFFNSGIENSTIENINEGPINFYDLRVSGPEINITTPLNITYTEPMNGYYPGTYGFENDGVGDDPYGWSVSEPGLQSVQVISDVDGHNNVLELFDTESSATDIAIANNSFSPQTSGTIEFWYRTSGFLEDQSFRTEYNLDISIYFAVISGNFEYYNASGWHVLAPHNNDQWYHIRFDFDCTSDTYDFYLDGILIKSNLEFLTAVSSIDKISFLTRQWGTSSDYYSYVDALGYSWDPNYSIGDNLNEGLLLSYENSTSLEWQGYSLDGASNKTILGNTTFPIPINDGLHTIQVFGNGTLGTMYQSDIRYFTTELIEVTTPQNITYTEPMNGYYPGTYGFENDEVGDDPYGWSVSEPGLQSVQVISDVDGHNNVLELFDTESSATDIAIANNSFSPQTSGTIEFWYRTSGFLEDQTLRTEYNLDISIYFAVISGNFEYYNASGWHVLAPHNNDQWYHIRFDFDCTSDTYDFYLDGILIQSNLEFLTAVSSIDKISFLTRQWGTSSDYYSYVDALGYSWDPNYSTGDNLNEGLLLSYENDIQLDWQGYSLDGASIKTILGNSTILLLSDGVHKIQVFGNNTMGRSFESKLRYFTIDTNSPTIIINSPSTDDFISATAPNFDLTITGLNLDTSWYTLDDGATNVTFTGSTGTINQTEWDKMGDGLVTIRFYALDYAGNENSTEVNVNKDSTYPIISITSPSTDDFIGATAPNFDITITESNLVNSWYTIDDGVTNITFTGSTGTINQTEWDKKGDGPVTVRFYAEDITGLKNFVDVVVQKDTTPPSSILSFTAHEATNIVIASTTFTLTADDGSGSGVSLIRYKINDSAWIPYSGPFTLSGYDPGEYLITYQAIDNLGSTETEKTRVVELISISSPPDIPGYNLLVLIGIVGIVGIGLIRKKIRS